MFFNYGVRRIKGWPRVNTTENCTSLHFDYSAKLKRAMSEGRDTADLRGWRALPVVADDPRFRRLFSFYNAFTGEGCSVPCDAGSILLVSPHAAGVTPRSPLKHGALSNPVMRSST